PTSSVSTGISISLAPNFCTITLTMPPPLKRPNNSSPATTLSFGTATDSWVDSPRKRSKAASVGGLFHFTECSDELTRSALSKKNDLSAGLRPKVVIMCRGETQKCKIAELEIVPAKSRTPKPQRWPRARLGRKSSSPSQKPRHPMESCQRVIYLTWRTACGSAFERSPLSL